MLHTKSVNENAFIQSKQAKSTDLTDWTCAMTVEHNDIVICLLPAISSSCSFETIVYLFVIMGIRSIQEK